MPMLTPILESNDNVKGHFQKSEAMIRLMCELNAGIHSGKEENWISEEDVKAHFLSCKYNSI